MRLISHETGQACNTSKSWPETVVRERSLTEMSMQNQFILDSFDIVIYNLYALKYWDSTVTFSITVFMR